MSVARLSEQQQALLAEMDIDVWQSRATQNETVTAAAVSVESAEHDQLAQSSPASAPIEHAAAEALLSLNKEILTCTRCELHQSRSQPVCGIGDLQADIFVVGDAPDADEDRTGEPFVGQAGQLLNEMLRAIGLERDVVFIANVLKCRPPEDRKPDAAEAAQCLPFLARQIDMVRPRIILSLGGTAAKNLLNVDSPVGKLRGQVHQYGEHQIPVVVTYHPDYLLHKPSEKASSWADLRLAMSVLAETVE
jgi:uracil-DNA glycosylase family 4